MSMPHVQPDAEFLNGDSTWVRMRTVVLVRWTAVAGQIGAILTVTLWFDLALPLFACALTIGALIVSNLLTTTLLPPTYRLTARELRALLIFDIVQLAVLLALTGGTSNPFALMMVAPVAIAATGLSSRSAILICAATLIASVAASVLSLPLMRTDGTLLTVPPLLRYGYLTGILITAIFISVYTHRVSAEIRNMARALMATQMALAREQKLTDIGGVVAAYAHELGTPLATIKLVSSELVDELSDHEDLNDLQEDAQLIREQADRCRDILHSMGRAGKDDLQMRQAPLDSLLHEAAEPHADRGRRLVFDVSPVEGATAKPPVILRAPEVIHGLRNLIQNAVDFSGTTVWIDGHWTDSHLIIRVIDDGPGYPPHLLTRIGDPFLRARPEETKARPEYNGMGLGLFIAKTLLERSGATITFRNGGDPFLDRHERSDRSGAIVELVWPLETITGTASGGLGENQLNPEV